MIEFKAPKGLEFPNNGGDGKTFDFLATVERRPDGMLYLVALDGLPIEKEAPEAEPPPEEQGGFLKRMSQAQPEGEIYNGA